MCCYTCCMLAAKPINKKLEERKRKAIEAAAAAEAAKAAANANASAAAVATAEAGEGSANAVISGALTNDGSRTPGPVSPGPGPAGTGTIDQQPAKVAAMTVPPMSGESIPLGMLEDADPPKERKRLTKAKKEKRVRLSEVDTIIPSPMPFSGESTPGSLRPGSAVVESEGSRGQGPEQQQRQEQLLQNPPRPSRPHKNRRSQPTPATQSLPPPVLAPAQLQEPNPLEQTRIVRARELISYAASQLRIPGFGRRPVETRPATAPDANVTARQQQRPPQHFDGSAGVVASSDSSSGSVVELLSPRPRRPVSLRFPFMGTTSAAAYELESSTGGSSHNNNGTSVDDTGDGGTHMQPQSSEATVVRRRGGAQPPMAYGRPAVVFAPEDGPGPVRHNKPGSSAWASTAARAGSDSTEDVVVDDAATADADTGPVTEPATATRMRSRRASSSVYYPAQSSPGPSPKPSPAPEDQELRQLSPPPVASPASRPSTNQAFQPGPEFAADGGAHAFRARSATSMSSAAARLSTNHLLVGAKMPAYQAPPAGGSS